ncbi:MAG: L-aspartate oxidase [Burkholderiales bacterium]|nr:L-aspartate oxidase [Burkholderiales bacterium]
MKFDVIIVGEGLSALTTVLKLPANLKVAVISRNTYFASSSYYAQGGIASVFSPTDSIDKHIHDTVVAGDYICDESSVKKFINQGNTILQWLIDLGVPFTKSNGALHLTREGGHSERRIAHVGDMTGRSIMHTVIDHAIRLTNITWIYDHEVLDLIIISSKVSGVIVENLINKQLHKIFASKTVLATGGITGLYKYKTNINASNGEGIAMANRAGAKISNLEFIQFHPTVFQLDGRVISLITEAVRGEGGVLNNINNERFMFKYTNQGELAPRDIVSRSIYSEMKETNSSNVWLDITHKGQYFVQEHFPNLTELTAKYGFDLSKTSVPVSPAAHYTCGGIETNIAGRTNIDGLYAIGEVANSGLHGANRLASNSLLECIVMGRECANDIANSILTIEKYHLDELMYIQNQYSVSLNNFTEQIQEILWHYAGIVRTSAGIIKGIENINQLSDYPKDLMSYADYLRCKNIRDAAMLILDSANKRLESKGCHFIQH